MQSVFGAADRGRTGTIGEDRGILSPLRLPIPPQRHKTMTLYLCLLYLSSIVRLIGEKCLIGLLYSAKRFLFFR